MLIYNKSQQEIAKKINLITARNDSKIHISNWKNWQWQVKHTIRDISVFERLLEITFSPLERKGLEITMAKFPLSITPYYLSLINKDDYKNDPIFKQSFPSKTELRITKYDMRDPLAEDKDCPVPGLTHRYPDRVLLQVSNICAMYCRHCTRKRKVGDIDSIPDKKEIAKAIEYIKNTPVVRDVLLSGGDPFMLPDDYIDWILFELRKIPHIEIIRIGTRTPVVLPYRITDDLVKILKKYHPLWINTHFNHPREITASSTEALAKLADAGIPLGNQSVLLADINDCPRIMKSLLHKLVQNRVRPYYLSLIGHTSGFCIPTYVIDAPGGGGKIPVMPNYLISWSTNKVILRNYEGIITSYKEPDSYEPIFCDRNCEDCKLHLQLDGAEESKAIGIGKLLNDYDKTISLIPKDNERINRRNS